MITAENAERAELIKLWALVATTRQLPTNRAKGEFLLAKFAECPGLLKYWRTAYDPRRWWPWRRDDLLRYTARLVRTPYDRPLDYVPLVRALRVIGEKGWPQAMDAWYQFLLQHPLEVQAACNLILDRDFRCGVSFQLLDKVFERGGWERIVCTGWVYRVLYSKPDQPYSTVDLITPGDTYEHAVRTNLLDGYLTHLRMIGVAVELPRDYQPAKS